MIVKRLIAGLFVASWMIGTSLPCQAQQSGTAWTEVGDAGDGTPSGGVSTAQVVSGTGNLLTITGKAGTAGAPNNSDADTYKINITNTSTFSATTVGSGSTMDSILTLFNSSGTLVGTGIVGNDDTSGPVVQSTIPAGNMTGLNPGNYYLTVSPYPIVAKDSNGAFIFPFSNGSATTVVAKTAGTTNLTSFAANTGSALQSLTSANNSYVITFAANSAAFISAVPEPSSLCLAGFALIGLIGVCRVSRKSRA